MDITLRRFSETDVPLKVRWINDPRNNRFLHYDLPLVEDATLAWFRRIQDSDSRLDLTIELDGTPVGIIGLLGIDRKNGSAELYITIGEPACKGKGIAGKAMEQLLRMGFGMGLNRIFLKTETENLGAVRAYEKFGFVREGCLRNELRTPNGYASRYLYAILKEEFEERYGTIDQNADSISGAVSG